MNYGSYGPLRSARTLRGTGRSSSLAGRLWQQLATVSELAVQQRYHAPWNPASSQRPTDGSERIHVA